jgi:hypothetical protein
MLKDIIDRYEDSKYPGLLELLFFLILIIDLILAIWMTFMAPLHISKMPYLKMFYLAIIPIAYIAPIVDAVCIKKTKKHLLLINNIYLSIRVVYFSLVFLNEIKYRIADASSNIDKDITSSIISSGVFSISFILIFSVAWIILINTSQKIKYHIEN